MQDAYLFVQLSRLALDLSTETAVVAAGAKLVSFSLVGVGLRSLQMQLVRCTCTFACEASSYVLEERTSRARKDALWGLLAVAAAPFKPSAQVGESSHPPI